MNPRPVQSLFGVPRPVLRRPLSRSAAIALAALSYAGVSQADPTAYIAERGGGFGTLDLETGAFTLLGNSGQTLAGLATVGATLYGASYHEGATTLYAVDPTSGGLSAIGHSTPQCDDFGSTVDQLYMVDTAANLYSFNAATGSVTLVGPTGIELTGWRSLSSGGTNLYFSNATQLYSLDTTTGAGALIGTMGNVEVGALLVQNGILYAGEDQPGGRLDTISLPSGAGSAGPAVPGAAQPFFGLANYPLPAAPTLRITSSNREVAVSWPPSALGWTLQTNASLANGAWGNYSGSVVSNTAVNSTTTTPLFYRLILP